MAKTNREIEYYRVLRNKMMAKAEMQNVSWARYYANLLDLGGVNNEQYLKNYFNDDMKKFNNEQLVTILLDLENFKNIEVITQNEMHKEVLKVVKEIGNLSGEMEKQFDNKDEIEGTEAAKILPKARMLMATIEKLVFRLEETKARG
ncbi:hypothetical protein N5T79_06500 [Aliarcobacter cryaerophilus]|uniref:hypothetical protein n=1 Tax=Aliarcobacter cryaerophilus TaxID=28198 RepID=UPI0021B6A7B0|nr:hypothetical protein [Aliarcobacter cryaerophilus]MCT7528792.1 hypothetical protein [Aliarcobacter cryaerophilus]